MTRVIEWRAAALPGFRCPSCLAAMVILHQIWDLESNGVCLSYVWNCRTPGCKFIAVDKDSAAGGGS